MSLGPEGGNIRSLAIDPINPQVVYAGTAKGGVFKSEDEGRHWRAVNVGLTDISFTTFQVLAIDPTNARILYAGASGPPEGCDPPRGVSRCNGGRVFKSTDGGGSWLAVSNGLPLIKPIGTLAVDPTNPQTVYAGIGGGGIFVETGVFKTADGGAHWNAPTSR